MGGRNGQQEDCYTISPDPLDTADVKRLFTRLQVYNITKITSFSGYCTKKTWISFSGTQNIIPYSPGLKTRIWLSSVISLMVR